MQISLYLIDYQLIKKDTLTNYRIIVQIMMILSHVKAFMHFRPKLVIVVRYSFLTHLFCFENCGRGNKVIGCVEAFHALHFSVYWAIFGMVTPSELRYNQVILMQACS